ncbi:MAG: (2Fe-2S) ferredoxin domain-containing protein [Verrucomicrobia bacterium]|nr:(2Fe-2S) ferredoxin domain-containing protein [Verrucomicrobiota bacterium]
MNTSVTVEICTGTTCFVMGAGHLLNLSEELPARLKDRVDLRGAHCLGVCNDPQNGKPPFARVDQKLLSDVSIESIIAACDRALADREGGAHAI